MDYVLPQRRTVLLSITALSSLFFVYLIGLIVTPGAGYLITRVGLRAGISGAISCSIAGVLLTLAPALPLVILGLAMLSSGVFIAQTASQSHLRVAAPSGARVTAAGIYRLEANRKPRPSRAGMNVHG